MKRLLLFIPVLFICSMLHGQMGIHVLKSGMDAPKWEAAVNEADRSFYFPGVYLGLDYWFRLKDQRIEFHPELSYRQNEKDYTFKMYGFHVNTNFYFLDFFDDCMCPTFGKKDPIFKKGLFFQLSPGISYMTMEVLNGASDVAGPEEKWIFDVGAGFGLDIGLSNYVTVTPQIKMRYSPGVQWSAATLLSESNETKSSLLWYEFGMGISMRFDQNNF
jgi:hypothetical protein